MKYKVLLAGNSKKLISNFFLQMDFAFECVTSSVIYDDLKTMSSISSRIFLSIACARRQGTTS